MVTSASLKRLVALLAGITVVFAGAGCGGDDEPTPDEAARAAADRFVSSLSAGEFETACGELTKTLLSQIGGEQCPDQLSAAAGRAGEDISIEVTNVRVSGPKAVAETSSSSGDQPKQESSFDLELTDGAWQISSLGD